VHPVSAMIGVDLGRAASWGIAGLAWATGTGLLGEGTWGNLGLGLGFRLWGTGILTNGLASGIGCLGISTNAGGCEFLERGLGEVAGQLGLGCARLDVRRDIGVAGEKGRVGCSRIEGRDLVAGIFAKGLGGGAELGGAAIK
jgi:hypothetical protein